MKVWFYSTDLIEFEVRLDLQCHCGAVGRSGTGGGAHFPKTAKEELEQGFNALVVVESRLPTRTKSCQIMSNKYELICVLVCLFVRVGSRNSTTTNTLNSPVPLLPSWENVFHCQYHWGLLLIFPRQQKRNWSKDLMHWWLSSCGFPLEQNLFK